MIAGGANWDSPFVTRVKETTDPRVKFLGPIYKDGHIKELHSQCYAYVHGNEVGGTNPALLKALGYGNCVLALDVPFNAEVVGDAAILYPKDPAKLAARIEELVNDESIVLRYRAAAPKRILENYQWPDIVRGYESLFERLRDGHYSAYKSSD